MDWERYERQLTLPHFGLEGQERLQQARVLVIGAGGLGCPVLQYLAAAGVGFIRVMDADVVSASNLHRQILFTPNDIGQPKATVARTRLLAQNPDIEIEAISEAFTPENGPRYAVDVDLVLDGSDNFATRYAADDVCAALGKPLVFAAVFQWEGQVAVFHWPQHLPSLEGPGGGNPLPSYRSLFPTPPSDTRDCATGGVLGVLPGVMGTLMAAEAIKVLTGTGTPLAGKLLVINLLNGRYQTLKLGASPTPNPSQERRPVVPAAILPTPNPSEEGRYILDVREPDERTSPLADNAIGIPFGELAARLNELDPATAWHIVCASGTRAKVAAQLLARQGFVVTSGPAD